MVLVDVETNIAESFFTIGYFSGGGPAPTGSVTSWYPIPDTYGYTNAVITFSGSTSTYKRQGASFSFRDIIIPKGSTIRSATLAIGIKNTGSGNIAVVHGMNRGRAGAGANDDTTTTNNPRGTATATLPLPTTLTVMREQEIDVKNIIQELVNAFSHDRDEITLRLNNPKYGNAFTVGLTTSSSGIIPLLIIDYSTSIDQISEDFSEYGSPKLKGVQQIQVQRVE